MNFSAVTFCIFEATSPAMNLHSMN